MEPKYEELKEFTLKQLEYLGLKYNSETIEYLKKYSWYNFNNELMYIVDALYFNKMYLTKDGIFGRIIRYSKKGDILAYFDNIFDASFDHIKGRYYYGLENFHEAGIFPYECDNDFYGYKIKNSDTCVKGDNNPLELLNKSISKMQYWINKYNKGKTYHSYIYEEERVVDDKKLNWAYIGQTNLFSTDIVCYLKNRNDKNVNKEMLERGINDLLNRYSFDNCSGFIKVEDIVDYELIPGVFVLELGELNKVAIWYDTLDICSGITSFLSGGPYSKCWIYPKDVSNIYLLPCDRTNAIKVYNDCGNYLQKELVIVYDVGNDDYKQITKSNPEKLLSDEERRKIVISVDRFVDERIELVDNLDDDGLDELYEENIHNDIDIEDEDDDE